MRNQRIEPLAVHSPLFAEKVELPKLTDTVADITTHRHLLEPGLQHRRHHRDSERELRRRRRRWHDHELRAPHEPGSTVVIGGFTFTRDPGPCCANSQTAGALAPPFPIHLREGRAWLCRPNKKP